MMVTGDVSELFTLPWGEQECLKVVKSPLRFEWPSVMLFNNANCSILEPEFVQNSNVHLLEWAHEIGELPPEWNYLVGYEAECGRPESPKLWHFTEGIPIKGHGYEILDDTGRDEWHKYLEYACTSPPWDAMMGKSVHKNHLLKKRQAAQQGKLTEPQE